MWGSYGDDGSVGEPAQVVYDHVYDIDRAPALPLADLTQLMGGKAANLVVMATEIGLPVPPAFAITTTVCKTYLTAGWPADLDAQIEAHVHRLAELTGRRLGDPGDPLLVSVRSWGAHLDAGDDGHDPQPGAQRRHGEGAGRPDRG